MQCQAGIADRANNPVLEHEACRILQWIIPPIMDVLVIGAFFWKFLSHSRVTPYDPPEGGSFPVEQKSRMLRSLSSDNLSKLLGS
jgi:hypothetical protein